MKLEGSIRTQSILLDVGEDVNEIKDVGRVVGLPRGDRHRERHEAESTAVEGHCGRARESVSP